MKEYYISIIIFHKPIALEKTSIIQNSDTKPLALENVQGHMLFRFFYKAYT